MSNEESAFLYQNNEDYKEYVDKVCKCNGHTLKEALQLKIVKEVGESYKTGGINERRQ